MSAPSATHPALLQHITVYRAEAFRVIHGAHLGDPLCEADALILDDTYGLTPGAQPATLTIAHSARDGGLTIAPGSPCGQSGAALHLDSAVTFMQPDGGAVEALVFVEVEAARIAAVYMMPLAPLTPQTEYRLIGSDPSAGVRRLAERAAGAFTRGTHIALAGGRQVKVEDLAPGDRILTRDAGPQTLRWIGQQTTRAVGAFAPVLISKGALNNANDLYLSPNHRVFIYQRNDALNIGRAEVAVTAADLIDGHAVTRSDGGFVEYFQLLFDDHQIIYAEGIAAESLLLDLRTRPVAPQGTPHASCALQGFDLPPAFLRDASVTALKRASAG